MKVNVRAAMSARTEREIERMTDRFLVFAQALGCGVCREIRGFGKIRLNRLVRGAYEEITEYYEHYGGDVEKAFENGMDPETVSILYCGLRNQITALEVPVDVIEETCALSPRFTHWRSPRDRQKREARHIKLSGMESAVRVFWYAMMLHLWHTYGWGKKRLTRFCGYVNRGWDTAMEFYLDCREPSDAVCLRTVSETILGMEKLGVKF